MEDFIKRMLEDIFSNTFLISSDALSKEISGYNETAFALANTINDTAVKPIAAIVVAIILVLELARVSSRFDGDSKAGVQVIASIMIKAAMLIIAIQNVDLILGAINEIGDTIIASIGGITSDQVTSAADIDSLDMGTLEQVGAMIILFIPWLIAIVAGIAVKLVVLLRFAEVYILSAGATLPLAFLGHEDTKQIAIGYLKRYATAVLHGVMILVVIAIYSALQIGGSNIPEDFSLSEVMKSFGDFLLGPVLFLFLIFGSGKFARALVGEG